MILLQGIEIVGSKRIAYSVSNIDGQYFILVNGIKIPLQCVVEDCNK